MMHRLSRHLPVVIALLLLFLVWQIGTSLMGVPEYILPRPIGIAMAIFDQSHLMGSALWLTGCETVLGFVLGALCGVALAILLILVPPLEPVLLSLAVAVNAVPSVAFVPLALIWFGLGMGSKVAMAMLAVGFVVFVNALAGLKQPEQGHIDLLRSFGGGALRILWKLRLPAALPAIVTGLRIGLSRSTIAVIVAEMLGAYAGLGQIIYQSTAQVDYLSVWAAVMVAILGSLALYGAFVALDRKLVWWT